MVTLKHSLKIWFCLTLLAPGAQAHCPGPFRRLADSVREWAYPDAARTFTVDKLNAARARYGRLVEDKNFSTDDAPQTLEEKIAFLEAVRFSAAGRAGAEPLPDQVFASPLARRGWARLLGPIDFDRGLTDDDVAKVMARYFLARHLDPESLYSLARTGWDISVQTLIRKRFEEALARRGLRAALAQLGMGRDPEGWERVGSFFRANARYLEVPLTLLGVAPIFIGHSPGYLPRLRLLENARVRKDLVTQVLRDGWEPALRAFAPHATFDLAYHQSRAAFLSAVAYLIVSALWDDSKAKAARQPSIVIAKQREVRAVIKSLDLSVPFEQKMLLDWRRTFQATHGHPPTAQDEALIQGILGIQKP